MSVRLPKYRTGDPELDESIRALVEQVGESNGADLIFEMVVTALRLARDGASRGDMKVANNALKEMRYAFSGVRPVPSRAEGLDLRIGPHGARRPALRADPPVGRRARRARVDGRDRCRSRNHDRRHRGRRTRQRVRCEHSPAVRVDHERVPRRRPEARELPLLLHPQAHVREGVRRVRPATWWLRDARRSLRDAHPHPDRQGPAGADRPARRAGRHVLAALARVRGG